MLQVVVASLPAVLDYEVVLVYLKENTTSSSQAQKRGRKGPAGCMVRQNLPLWTTCLCSAQHLGLSPQGGLLRSHGFRPALVTQFPPTPGRTVGVGIDGWEPDWGPERGRARVFPPNPPPQKPNPLDST